MLILFYIILYYIKTCVHGVKTYGINGKEALTGDWEELNKETCVFKVYLQNNFKVSACKYKLIKLLTFIWVLTFIEVSGCHTKPTSATFLPT